MEYTEDFLRKIVQVGTLAYPLSKIINVLDIDDISQFSLDFDNPNSEIYKSYQKGLDKADFLIDSKLFDMAKNGDLDALNKYEIRKRNYIHREQKESKQRI